jgi:hypothetical protein
MADGAKRNETRSWSTAYRGDLVICSARRKPTIQETGLDPAEFAEAMRLCPFGFALCVVRLSGCVKITASFANSLTQRERDLGDYTPGRYAWVTEDLRELAKPVPVVGKRGLFSLRPEESFAVIAQSIAGVLPELSH